MLTIGLLLPLAMVLALLLKGKTSWPGNSYYLRHILYSHLVASYTTAIAVTAVLVRFDARKFFTMAFPMFLAPTGIPLFLTAQTEMPSVRQLICVVAIYLLVFSSFLVFLRILWRRTQKYWQLKAQELAPVPVVPLQYFSFVPHIEPVGKIVWVAGCVAIAAIATQILFCTGVAHFDQGFGGIAKLWTILGVIPSVAATVVGLVAVFKTKPSTMARQTAMLSLCVGLTLAVLMLFVVYVRFTGLDKSL